MRSLQTFGEVQAWIDAAGGPFLLDFQDYLFARVNLELPLNGHEELAYLLSKMEASAAINGFSSLFDQTYSLQECELLEKGLRTLQLDKLADLFAEALLIHVRGRRNVTQEQYEAFAFRPLRGKAARRFDTLEEQFWAEGSELYQVWLRLYEYIRTNPEPFAEVIWKVLHRADRDYLRGPGPGEFQPGIE